MKKNTKTPRFDVDYTERLKQRQEASNAYRLPRMGYELYRIYVIEKPREVTGFYTGQTLTIKKTGQRMGKTYGLNQAQITRLYGELFKTEPAYEVKWLKPKQATLLRMRGHRVKPAEPGDRVGHVGPIEQPVKLWR